jgi:hypothetical protein
MIKMISIMAGLYLIAATSIYEFKVPSLEGSTIDFFQVQRKIYSRCKHGISMRLYKTVCLTWKHLYEKV